MAIIFFGLVSCDSSKKYSTEPDQEPSKLKGCEGRIDVQVSGDTIYSVRSLGYYYLAFTTALKSLNDDLKIVDYGCYYAEDGGWVDQTEEGRKFGSVKDFEESYNCPNGLLKKNISYYNDFNWVIRTKELDGSARHVLLYFLAEDGEGNLFKGTKTFVGILEEKK
ncbi:MAG: hypothetical protein Crog4KO_06540 [Crocinitomicaceae bacterium]